MRRVPQVTIRMPVAAVQVEAVAAAVPAEAVVTHTRGVALNVAAITDHQHNRLTIRTDVEHTTHTT